MTPGATGETVDGISLDKIEAIIDAVRHERYRWTPAKRVYIPKKSGCDPFPRNCRIRNGRGWELGGNTT
jgi:retron-type reverse transcriptase